ncbi:MAG: DinB family protein, partial [Chloroflexi bacterium]|nr:DinB family protein [Chloroflexota bacterium]
RKAMTGHAQEQIARIESTVQTLLDEIEQLPADVLYRAPKTGDWPVMSTLAHLAELLPFWAHEAAGLAAAPGTPIGRHLDDPRRVDPIEAHAQDSLSAIVPAIRASLAECLATLRAIPETGWQTVGQHISRGPMSVEQLVQAFLCNHATEHANQIHATLRELSAAPQS